MSKNILLLLFAICAPIMTMAQIVPPSEEQPVAQYRLYVGGIPVARAKLGVSASSARYIAHSEVITSGPIGWLIKSTITSAIIGRVGSSGQLLPSVYESRTNNEEKDQTLRMVYQNDRPQEVQSDPPMTRAAFELNPKGQDKTLDPLSAILSVFLPRKDVDLCNRMAVVYDGKRRYEVRLSPIEVQTPPGERLAKPDTSFVQCGGVYERIAGYKPSMMTGQYSYPFDIWFEKLPGGDTRIVRISGDTLLGLAVVKLKD